MATRARAPRVVQGVPADPEHLGTAGARRRLPARPPSGSPTRCAEAGLEHVEVAETGGHPVVYADWLHAPDAPTVLVYGHYDVQPVDPLDLWTSPPFEPVVVGGPDAGPRRSRRQGPDPRPPDGRRRPARDARAAAGQRQVPVRGRGGIELGPPRARGSRPTASGSPPTSRSSATPGSSRATCRPSRVGLRGMMYAQIDVVGHGRRPAFGRLRRRRREPGQRPGPDHRGAQGPGRPDPDPGLLRRRRAADRRPTAAAIAALPFDEEAYRERLGVPALVGEVGYTTLERRGARPTLDVNGIWGGFQGEGSKTIIPAHAHAKVSCRLVAAQDPDRIFEAFKAFVEEIAPPGVTTTVRLLGGGLPSLTPMDHPATQAAARALEATFGRAPRLHPRGRLDPGLRQLRVDPRPAGRAPRLRPARRPRPRARTSGWTSATTRRASGRSPGPGTSWSTCRAERRRGLCGNGTFG